MSSGSGKLNGAISAQAPSFSAEECCKAAVFRFRLTLLAMLRLISEGTDAAMAG